jgi:hypothetical protein
LPKSYLVDPFIRLKVEKKVIGGTPFKKIQKGRYKRMNTAIRTLKLCLADERNLPEIHEVLESGLCYHPR